MPDVLLVDDSTMLRLLVSYTLSGSDGFTVRECSNATEALGLLQREDFALMLTDFHMPGLDGVELVRAVRGMPRHAGLPVIMMTSDTDPLVEREAREAGVDGFVVKPFEPEQLHAEIGRMLGHALGPEAPADPPTVTSRNLMEAFPYPAMLLNEEHEVVMGNLAYYEMTGSGISDCPPKCRDVMHGEYGMPVSCPLAEAVRACGPAEAIIEDRVRGKLQVSVYPLDSEQTGGTRLFLHLARPLAG